MPKGKSPNPRKKGDPPLPPHSQRNPRPTMSYSALEPQDIAPEMLVKYNAFISHFMRSRNATRAANECGYWKESNATTQGYALMKVPYIAAEIERRTKTEQERLTLSVRRTEEEIAALAHVNMADFTRVDEKTGRAYTDFRLMSRADFAAIQSLETETYTDTEGETVVLKTKAKIIDKTRANELAARRQKMLTDKSEISNPDGSPILPPALTIHFTEEKKKDEE